MASWPRQIVEAGLGVQFKNQAAQKVVVVAEDRIRAVRRGSSWSGWLWAGVLVGAMGLLADPVAGRQNRDGAAKPAGPVSSEQVAAQKMIETLAVVNEQAISREQVAKECMKRFGKDVLQDIVNKFLVSKELERSGIVITERDINSEIASEAGKLGWTSDRWLEVISTNRNLTIDRIKNDYVWNKLALRSLVSSRVSVTREELDRALESEFGSRVQVRQIVVDNERLAEELAAEARANPGEFERLAKKHSLDPNSASLGGLLQPIRRHSGFPEFEEVAFALTPGQVSPPIKVADAYIIMRCERMFPAEQIPAEELAFFEERLTAEISNSKLGEAAVDLFAQIQAQAEIVNVLNNSELRQQYPGVAAIVNGSQIPVRYVAEECIARYGHEMLKTEINRLLLQAELRKAGLQVSQEDITAEIARAAESMRYVDAAGNIQVEAWLETMTEGDLSKVEFYIEDEVWPSVALKKLVERDVKVTPEDLKKGFEANFGPRVEVLAILTNNDREAAKIWKMASGNPTADFFGKLANQYSIEPASRNNFGQVPPIQKHGGRPELEKEAFSLRPGELSKAVQVGEYWVILYCLGYTEPVVTDFDAVKGEIHDNILEKKLRIAMYDRFQQLVEDAQIYNYLTGTSQTGRAQVREAKR
jgi:parvulin-like peptidyl-prolyl isomerase